MFASRTEKPTEIPNTKAVSVQDINTGNAGSVRPSDQPTTDGSSGCSQDPVNHPRHYNSGKIEVIEAIEDWKLGFHLGNAVKYVARAGKKDPAKTVEDLEKAIFYIRRQIEKISENPRRPNEMPQARIGQ